MIVASSRVASRSPAPGYARSERSWRSCLWECPKKCPYPAAPYSLVRRRVCSSRNPIADSTIWSINSGSSANIPANGSMAGPTGATCPRKALNKSCKEQCRAWAARCARAKVSSSSSISMVFKVSEASTLPDHSSKRGCSEKAGPLTGRASWPLRAAPGRRGGLLHGRSRRRRRPPPRAALAAQSATTRGRATSRSSIAG